ncbi:uncharacterized protein [Cardiocondyla obscurior]|uniref:uncharacterized protein n=1 Tax=Cardiocondyla obscurior TaxID=286306 RepID=UPI0039658797
MEHPGEQYFKLNRHILSITGLWPYQKKWIAYLLRIIIIVILVSSIIFQISSFLIFDISVNLVMDIMTEVLPTMGSLNHMIARIKNMDKLRDLFDHVWNDWRLQEKHYKIKILRKRAKITKLVTFYYILIQYILVIVYNLWLFTPDILDIISPMNESRPRQFTLKVFTDKIEFYHTVPFLLDLIGIVLLTSVALTQIVLLTSDDDFERIFKSVSVAVMSLIYVFILNYMGQVIMDTTANVYEKAYNSAWYLANISEQKSLLLIMKRRVHPLVLTACKFCKISLQNFGKINLIVFPCPHVFVQRGNMDRVRENDVISKEMDY